MNVATLILQLRQMAQPDGEVTLIVEEVHYPAGCREVESYAGVFTGKVIGTGTGAEKSKCEIYGIS
jgi:hypothetical protein